jgi:CrcB-like protein, Camphor Resistance (CrcB)
MPHPNLRLMVITGFLGGYTTFSTFENDALTLWERGEGILMAVNVIGSVTAGFAAVLLGTALARGLTEPANQRAVASEHSHPARTNDDQSISAKVDAVGRVGGQRGTNQGSQ